MRDEGSDLPVADLDLARDDPAALLWRQLETVRTGMLGLTGLDDHLQPMTHHSDRATGTLWFLTRRDSDLFAALTGARGAHFVLVAPEQDFYACLRGALLEKPDDAMLDAMWNSVSASFFAGGRTDPQIAVLALQLEDAAIWASTGSSLVFAWEVAKANVLDGPPDIGVRNSVRFAPSPAA